MPRFIPRVVLGLLIAVALWEGFVYLASRPRFWVRLAGVAERIGTSALHIYSKVEEDQQRRSHAPARTGDTITDIEEYLLRKRSP